MNRDMFHELIDATVAPVDPALAAIMKADIPPSTLNWRSGYLRMHGLTVMWGRTSKQGYALFPVLLRDVPQMQAISRYGLPLSVGPRRTLGAQVYAETRNTITPAADAYWMAVGPSYSGSRTRASDTAASV